MLHFKRINTEVALDILGKDTLNVRLVDFSGEEHCGLRVEGLSTEVHASGRRLEMPYLRLSLPDSQLEVADVALQYDSLRASGDNLTDRVLVQGELRPSRVKLDDLGAFVPQLHGMKAVVSVQARASAVRMLMCFMRFVFSIFCGSTAMFLYGSLCRFRAAARTRT